MNLDPARPDEDWFRHIGARSRDNAIVWILGGHQNIKTDQEYAIIESMAFGLRERVGGTHLITFHPLRPANEWFSIPKDEKADNSCDRCDLAQAKELNLLRVQPCDAAANSAILA